MPFPRPWKTLLAAAVAIALPAAASAETAYFLVGGGTTASGPLSQSFVVPTSDAPLIAQARSILAGTASRYTASNYRVRIRVAPAPGGDLVNRNYYAANRPAWNWRVAELVRFVFIDYSTAPGSGTSVGPVAPPDLPGEAYAVSPAEIAVDPPRWIATYGDTVEPWGFQLVAEVTPGAVGAPLVNFSTRGRTGPGEDRLISGVVVGPGAPKLAVIRALGPSLAAAGVTNVVSDPRLEVYLGGTKIFESDSWQASGRAAELTALGLAPSDPREAALLVPLYPGAYTIHVIGSGAATGVCLLEIYALEP